ncbi:type II toxin-antitoxin system VapC family toxin [Arundinibacter roseus]|uniref:PIN domain-containing protein n=1 Tax=Arundinibacter roseus TaxID=2070510 RepID=A0A4R4KBI9_9BACT|nr:PIN domain-containing protein [Arundinibacter roseus]TDB64122.1 PIN domain-containing protein [Arundinibacter roseus]
MKEAVFVDTDVIVDFLIDRVPFSQKSAEVFVLAEKEEIVIYVSSLCYSNIFYILRKLAGLKKAMELLQKLESLTEILPVGKIIIRQALAERFEDFEDGIQNFTALQEPLIRKIITRNVKDFKKSELSIVTPDEYISMYLSGKK